MLHVITKEEIVERLGSVIKLGIPQLKELADMLGCSEYELAQWIEDGAKKKAL